MQKRKVHSSERSTPALNFQFYLRFDHILAINVFNMTIKLIIQLLSSKLREHPVFYVVAFLPNSCILTQEAEEVWNLKPGEERPASVHRTGSIQCLARVGIG